MNTNMQGHNHGGKNHLLGMLGIGAVVLVVLLGAGVSLRQALPYAVFLACPLMMVGMMYMMRGGMGQQHGNDTSDHRDHNDATNQGNHDGATNQGNHHEATNQGNQDAAETWQDSPNITPPQGTTRP